MFTKSAYLLFILITSGSAFTVHPAAKLVFTGQRTISRLPAHSENQVSFDPLNLADTDLNSHPLAKNAAATAAFLALLSGIPEVSNAAGPDWGIFEGKTGSLLHPITMGSLFFLQISTALKGIKWRRQREIGDEISTLKKQMPKLPEGASSLNDAIAMGKEAGSDVSVYQGALAIESQIANLTAERKELASQNNRESHYQQGALVAAIGTAFAIEGPLNTYARAGKLFPGPHLYAGAGLVVCWAIAAGCVPFMQKGSDTARSLHIGFNALGMGLFAWQVQSGIPILLKVYELTKWP